jgi:hypothetical protein
MPAPPSKGRSTRTEAERSEAREDGDDRRRRVRAGITDRPEADP